MWTRLHLYAQWLLGFFIFMVGQPGSTRARMMPWHITGGRAILFMSVCTALTGLMQKATVLGLQHEREARVVNFTALFILLFGVFVDLTVSLAHYVWFCTDVRFEWSLYTYEPSFAWIICFSFPPWWKCGLINTDWCTSVSYHDLLIISVSFWRPSCSFQVQLLGLSLSLSHTLASGLNWDWNEKDTGHAAARSVQNRNFSTYHKGSPFYIDNGH